jgi:hypothetical protein
MAGHRLEDGAGRGETVKFAGLWLLSCLCAWGSSTLTWEMTSYQDFVKGKFTGISLARDGDLLLAPKLEPIFNSDQPVIWSLAQGKDGSIYAATGHRGKLYRIDAAGKSTLLWTAPQPEIFALAVDSSGAIYAATSPEGKIYRIENGKAAIYFEPKARYIWSLVFGPDGALYAGTGDQGKVFRITAQNQGDEYYATGQTHVTGLTFDMQKRLLAGTEPNGILYRITARDKAFALYNASLPEIRAIGLGPDGSIYAAGLGGSLARRGQATSGGTQSSGGAGTTPTVTTSITVTAEGAAAGPDMKGLEKPAAAAAPTPAAAAATPTQATEVSGVEKSAIYRIRPDNTVETLWTSKEENIYDLLPMNGEILFSTDGNGRLYRLAADHKVTLISQTNDAEMLRLLPSGSSVLAATGTMGRVYRLSQASNDRGTYESPIYDAGTISRWGEMRWQGAGSVEVRTRTGNSLRPDRTWSDWSAPLHSGTGAQVTSPNARYIQWDAQLAKGATAPHIQGVSVSYLPQNSPPAVRSIVVAAAPSTAAATSKSAIPAGSTSAYAITVTDTGDAGPATSTGTPVQTLSRAASQQIVITWQAEDPEGDKLVYSLSFRGEGEREWKLLKLNLHENTYGIDADTLADGRYYFRVNASDRESNPPGQAMEAELISSPVLIDNTPPVVTITHAGAVLNIDAADATSPLRRCEYSMDGEPWVPLAAADGVIDSAHETFRIELDPRKSGEHVVVVRATDTGNNTGLAKIVLH